MAQVKIDGVVKDDKTCYKLISTGDVWGDYNDMYLGKAKETPVMRGSGDGRELTVAFEHMPIRVSPTGVSTTDPYIGRGGDFDGNKQNMFEIVECETTGGRRRRRTIRRKRRRTVRRRLRL